MTIPILQEPRDVAVYFGDFEACCFCHDPTDHWTNLRERAPGDQVACCPGCSDIFDVDVVPTKAEWWDYHAAQQEGW